MSETFTQPPDERELEGIALGTTESVQPAWVREIIGPEAPHEHRLRSVRCAEHHGHEIEIVTTYEISIDGAPFHVHATVGDDGRLRCHESPYAALPSAIDLVKHLMDLYPEAFDAPAPQAPPHTHAEHDHGHDT